MEAEIPDQPEGFAEDEGSITRVIRRMQKGDSSDAQVLWTRFFMRLKFLVKEKINPQMRLLLDEEDLALDSLAELFKGLLVGQYETLGNREEFWRLLVVVASRNVIDEINREGRLKRGAGKVFGETSLLTVDDDQAAFFERIASSELPPDVQLMITEQVARLLETLPDGDLQTIALMKASEATNQEISAALGISLRTVERRLKEIRDRWSAPDSASNESDS